MTSEITDYREQGRDPALGGWCFSNGEHRWPVSDCTAEALCAVLQMHRTLVPALPDCERIPEERIGQAAGFILSRQNANGGFGTYERRRGSSWLEAVNPSEMFGQCMTERSYLECTGSSLSALAAVREAYPMLLRSRIDEAIRRGVLFLQGRQRPDGSYAAFWGINFTYAIFHVVKGLRAAGVPGNDAALIRAAEWLISKQRADGGWGEHYSGCLEDRYVEHSQSQVVMTSWALLALMETVGVEVRAVTRGIAWLRATQSADGSWPQQSLNGVFFGSAMLDYRLYKTCFPVWVLARHASLSSGGNAQPLRASERMA
jgi:lanosterol synthase